MTASVTAGRALRYAGGSARGHLHHPVGHYPIGEKMWNIFGPLKRPSTK